MMRNTWLNYLKDILLFFAAGVLLVYLAIEVASFLDKHYAGDLPHWLRFPVCAAFLGVAVVGFACLPGGSYKRLKDNRHKAEK